MLDGGEEEERGRGVMERCEIWKFPLEGDGKFVHEINMPMSHKFLYVGEQNGKLFLWAAIFPKSPVELVVVDVIGTGWGFEMLENYFGSCSMSNGFVWHVFTPGGKNA